MTTNNTKNKRNNLKKHICAWCGKWRHKLSNLLRIQPSSKRAEAAGEDETSRRLEMNLFRKTSPLTIWHFRAYHCYLCSFHVCYIAIYLLCSVLYHCVHMCIATQKRRDARNGNFHGYDVHSYLLFLSNLFLLVITRRVALDVSTSCDATKCNNQQWGP